MGIQIKINGGTPVSGKALCHTCKHASIVKGQNLEEHIHCDTQIFASHRGRVPFRVSECSSFHPSNIPWKWEMEEMAWIVQARKRGPAGFTNEGSLEFEIKPPTKNNQVHEDAPE